MSTPVTLVEALIRAKFKGWPLPPPTMEEWISCRCPWHQDSNPSASISYQNDAFNCHACGVKGDGISLLMKEEGITDYKHALLRAAELVGGDYTPVQVGPARKSGRRVFSGERPTRRGGAIPPRRGRRTFAGA